MIIKWVVQFAELPIPSCKCVNIAFFDIMPYYFRTGINCPFILVDDDNNWKEIVLKIIEEFGKPKNITSNPNEMDMFNYKADYNRTCLKKSVTVEETLW